VRGRVTLLRSYFQEFLINRTDDDMIELSKNPGLVTRIENGWMHVKVPVGSGCGACAIKSQCTFSGPNSAYRTFRVRQVPDCRVGDRILVHVPANVLGVTGIVLVGLPVAMILAGYWLIQRYLQFPYATPLLWLAGIAIWLVAIFSANRWVDRSARFSERITPVKGNAE
jgi:positive regulator of sigma E activity